MRKFFYLFVIMLSCLALMLPSIANAHPGRTDSNGGHTCYTNCEKWGLEYGEYHYHNDGDSSTSNSESNSNTDTKSESNTNSSPEPKSNSYTNSNSKSTSESSNDKPATEKPKAKPKPKIDKKQVQADEHYQNAVNYFENEKYKKALKELDKIYDLKRDDNKTDKLVQNSLTAMYKLAKIHLDDEEYEKAKELLEFILDFPHTNKQIIEKAEKLLDNVILFEDISLLLTKAETAKDNKEYEEALSFINEARDLKEIDDISSLFDTIMDDILDEAQAAHLKNEFEKAISLYTLLEEHVNSSKLEEDYQATIHK